jgi:hypothetical protein
VRGPETRGASHPRVAEWVALGEEIKVIWSYRLLREDSDHTRSEMVGVNALFITQAEQTF